MSDGEHREEKVATETQEEFIEVPPSTSEPQVTESTEVKTVETPGEGGEAPAEETRVEVSTEASEPTEPANDPEAVSSRLFVRPIKFHTSMEDVEKLFTTVGEVKEISLKPGYGFIEYVNADSANEAIEKLNNDNSLGYDILIERAMARGTRRPREETERPPKPTANHRLEITGVKDQFSWQDLKDLARTKGVEAVFTKVDPEGVGLIDVATETDRDNVLSLTGYEWRGSTVEAKEDPRGPPPPPPKREPRFGGRGGGRGGRGGFGDRRGGRGGFGDRRGGGRFGGDRFGDRFGNDRYERRDRGRGDRRGGSYERQRSRSPPRREEGAW